MLAQSGVRDRRLSTLKSCKTHRNTLHNAGDNKRVNLLLQQRSGSSVITAGRTKIGVSSKDKLVNSTLVNVQGLWQLCSNSRLQEHGCCCLGCKLQAERLSLSTLQAAALVVFTRQCFYLFSA